MKKIALIIGLFTFGLVLGAQAVDVKNTTSAKPAVSSHTAAVKAELLDINTATLDQLKALKGIGDVYAQKIVDGRPYRTKLDLMKKKVLSPKVYSGIKNLIVAKQAK